MFGNASYSGINDGRNGKELGSDSGVCMQPSFPLFMLFMFVLVSYLIWLSSVAHE